MPIDNVLDITPRVQYVSSASQTAFAYPFPIFEDADLVVIVDGVTKTLTTDYTVSGEGDDTGGTVTFLSGQTAGSIVTIYRDIAIQRTSDFQTNGPLSSATFNDELDRLTLVEQQLEALAKRAIRLPFDAEVTDAELELNVADVGGKYLRLTEAGKPEGALVLEGSTLSQSTFDALLPTTTASLPATQVEYGITAAEQAAGVTPTNLYIPDHETTGGIFDPQRYGFVGDANATGSTGTDDTTAIQNAINVANAAFLSGSYGGAGGIVLIPAARFRYTGLIVKKGVSVEGMGTNRTIGFLVGTSATGIKCAAATSMLSADQVSYGSLKEMTLATAEATPVAQIHWNAIGFSRWTVKNVLFTWGTGLTGISVKNATPASLGGPAQWFNRLEGVELLHTVGTGGIGADLGNADTAYEGITTWTWVGGRANGGGYGTARSFAGAQGCISLGFVTESCSVALSVGEAAGARNSVSNVFMDYYEGNTTNRSIKATAFGTMLLGSFVTGGVDSDLGTKTIFMEYGASEDFRIPAGLKFASTSSDANALDYYAEGTITPTATFDTPGDVAPTYGGSNGGKYMRVGRTVYFDYDLHLTNLTFTTAVGDLRLGGLPFAPGAVSNLHIGLTDNHITYSAGKTWLSGQTIAGQTYIKIGQTGSASATAYVGVANLATGNALRIQLSGSYQV